MSDFIFLFDLDSTITKQEILHSISQKVGAKMQVVYDADGELIAEESLGWDLR